MHKNIICYNSFLYLLTFFIFTNLLILKFIIYTYKSKKNSYYIRVNRLKNFRFFNFILNMCKNMIFQRVFVVFKL